MPVNRHCSRLCRVPALRSPTIPSLLLNPLSVSWHIATTSRLSWPTYQELSRAQVRVRDSDSDFCAISSVTPCCSLWCLVIPTTSRKNTRYCSTNSETSIPTCSTSTGFLPSQNVTCSTTNLS